MRQDVVYPIYYDQWIFRSTWRMIALFSPNFMLSCRKTYCSKHSLKVTHHEISLRCRSEIDFSAKSKCFIIKIHSLEMPTKFWINNCFAYFKSKSFNLITHKSHFWDTSFDQAQSDFNQRGLNFVYFAHDWKLNVLALLFSYKNILFSEFGLLFEKLKWIF